MSTKGPLVDLFLITLVGTGTILGIGSSVDEEQELYHLWTAEPELATAIACRDNDFGCEHPDDPNRHRRVPLPMVVRRAFCNLTSQTFAKAYYDGPVRYEDLFGWIYRLDIPDSNTVNLYACQLKEYPELSFRWYSIAVVLYDRENDEVSAVPVVVDTDYQHFCPRPWIRFGDLLGDERLEILLLTGHHRGTEADWILLHVLRIHGNLDLHEVLTLRTGILMPFAFAGRAWEERRGFAVRTVEKVDREHCTVTVTLSKSKLKEGDDVLGRESWEMGDDGRMHRTMYDVVVDEKHDYIFSEMN
jgi:hypothetical protein